MSLLNLTVEQLERVVALVKEKEELQSKVADVDRQLKQIEAGGLPVDKAEKAIRSAKKPTTRRKKAGRGTLQDSVLAILKQAGAKGLSVKEMATRAKVKPGSLSVWLYTKAKTIPGFKKIGPGTFGFVP